MGKGTGPPALNNGDFSEKAVQKTVKAEGLGHWLTRYPPAAGLGAIFTAYLFDLTMLYAVGAALLIAGGANALVKIKVLGEKFAESLRLEQRMALEKKSAKEVEELKKKLVKLGKNRAAIQVEDLRKGFARFKEKLDAKIGENMREYNQYLGSAHEMYAAALHNLNGIVDNALDIRAIDPDDTKGRIKELNCDSNGDNGCEIKTLEKQLQLVEMAETSNRELTAEVESAITAFAEITHSLSDIKINREDLDKDAQRAMSKFRETAARNKLIYDKVAESWRKFHGLE